MLRKLFLMLLLFNPGLLSIKAQDPGIAARIYASYISGDMTDWIKVLDELEDIYSKTGSYQVLHQWTIAQYGYIGFCLIDEDKVTARRVLSKAEDNIQILLQHDPERGDFYALSGALYGLKIGIDPVKTVFYGRKAIKDNARALELSPGDPRVWMEKGNLELYKPEIFGRDPALAIEAYEKAVFLFEKQAEAFPYNWLLLNTLTSLARAHKKLGKLSEANASYQEILRLEPDILWIRDKEYARFLEGYQGE